MRERRRFEDGMLVIERDAREALVRCEHTCERVTRDIVGGDDGGGDGRRGGGERGVGRAALVGAVGVDDGCCWKDLMVVGGRRRRGLS